MEYRYGNELNLDQVTELYRASTLGERRPIDDRAVVRSMLKHANLVVTAWDGDLMVGIARTLTDFAYVGYLSDLAVRESHQRHGIGIALIQKTRERLGPRSMLVLLAAPKAVEYYPRLGFKRHNSAWVLRASESLGRPEGTRPPNKGMKLTRPERIGALQLIPGVRLLVGRARARKRARQGD